MESVPGAVATGLRLIARLELAYIVTRLVKEQLMSTSRRKFLKLSALAGGSVGLGLLPGVSALSNSAVSSGKARKPLRILILGGTGFTGPSQVKYALSRRHKITVFNRGKTHPGQLPEGIEQL